MGLATRKCTPCENGNLQPLSESAAYTLRNQVSGLAGRASSLLAVHFDGWTQAAHQSCAALKLFSPQVPGWRLEKTDQGSLCLRQEWKVKDSRSGDELIKRIGDVAEAEGHPPELHMKDDSAVAAELSTHAIGMQII